MSAVESWEHLHPAPQTGPSCGFFANIPALTLATGVDISASPWFVSQVYGLRRGDFKYERSFDKRLFFELFALPWEEKTVHHEVTDDASRIAAAETLLEEEINPGLARGCLYSLRVRGVLGGPHNVLLIARKEDRYIIHNPYPGFIRGLSSRELADIMAVRSTSKANQNKAVYLSSWLEIRLPAPLPENTLPYSALPAEIPSSLDPQTRSALTEALHPRHSIPKDAGLRDLIDGYPRIDFAALPPLRRGAAPIPAIGNQIPARNLVGLIALSKFQLAVWKAGRSRRVPVFIIDNQPWVLCGYRRLSTDTKDLVFDNGRELLWLSSEEAMNRIRAEGAVYGTVEVPPSPTINPEKKPPQNQQR
ncbi:MAG: hypothetical protein MUF31_13900 [Akkermansiaceae bacterium]|jgi:hypothetical protein|nr:hypothetical protein [Akkermansiaceae bacterium]